MRILGLFSALLLPLLTQAQAQKLLTFNETLAGGFAPRRMNVRWVPAVANGSSDGLYITSDAAGSLIFGNIVDNTTDPFVDVAALGLDYYDYFIQPSQENVLFSANYTKGYRHSYLADYYVFNRASGSLRPLVAEQSGDVQYAAWSPVGNVIAFVRGNDLYIWNDGRVRRVTEDGGPDVFNGVPDWVYEEEIFGDRSTLWFSPDGEYLAFLRMNETGVPTYTVPYYMAGQTVAPAYPHELEIRYPKVSQTNPTVMFHLLQLSTLSVSSIAHDSFAAEDLIIGEVAWVADAHENVLFRAFNRVQDREKLVLVDVAAGTSKVVRERDGTDGWLDNSMSIQYVGALDSSNGEKYYIDLSDHTGWPHIYLFSVAGSVPAKALTKGEWAVAAILKIDVVRGLVYYLSTERHSTERHLYSVSLLTGRKTALVDTGKDGYWAASFSSNGGYYILSYNGPNLPYQHLYSIDSRTPLATLNDNAALETKLSAYRLPTTRYHVLRHPSGYTLNAREILPPNFNPQKKYPVLFDPYGGPGSQDVSKAYLPASWRHYIASDPELEYIVVTVDGRGTGYQGRKFRTSVVKQLGRLEAEDQVWAGRLWRAKSYVDGDHMAMWGWSFGGYLTAKVVELDSGVFSLGLITAPVSDWRFYDSMYTERYMKTLEMNPAGYNASAVAKPEGFRNIPGSVLIQHGTGDDNVHFQHSVVLVDTLTLARVPPHKLDVQWFSDSDHNNDFHGADRFLFKQITGKLYEEKRRKDTGGGHQWSRRGGAKTV